MQNASKLIEVLHVSSVVGREKSDLMRKVAGDTHYGALHSIEVTQKIKNFLLSHLTHISKKKHVQDEATSANKTRLALAQAKNARLLCLSAIK